MFYTFKVQFPVLVTFDGGLDDISLLLDFERGAEMHPLNVLQVREEEPGALLRRTILAHFHLHDLSLAEKFCKIITHYR